MAPKAKIEDYVATRGIAVRLSTDKTSPDYETFWEAEAGDSLEDAPDHIDVQGLLDVEAICKRSTWEKAQARAAPAATADDPPHAPRAAVKRADAQRDGISTPGGASASSGPGTEDLNDGKV
jgi:hypothetical protein